MKMQAKKLMFHKLISNFKSEVISFQLKLKIAKIIDDKNIFNYAKPFVAYHAACIISNGRFYKVATNSSNTILKEYENFVLFKNAVSGADILPKLMLVTGESPYLVMNRLYPISENELYISASKLLVVLKAKGKVKLSEINQHWKLEAGLKLLTIILRDGKIEVVKEQLKTIFKKEMRIGITHGDFCFSNVMFDEFGKIKLIDFDCVEEFGIQDLDIINWVVFDLQKKLNMDWRLVILNIESHISESEKIMLLLTSLTMSLKEVLLIYFVERIGKISKFYPGSFMNDSELNYKVIDFLIEAE